MKEIYLHKNDIPKNCVDCDFRQNTYCKAQRIDDREYVSCNQSKNRMKNGKPITCPLKCIESDELCEQEEVRKETVRNVLKDVIKYLGINETDKNFQKIKWIAFEYVVDLEDEE